MPADIQTDAEPVVTDPPPLRADPDLLANREGDHAALRDAHQIAMQDRGEQRTIRYDSAHPALCGYRCCVTPADYADLRDTL